MIAVGVWVEDADRYATGAAPGIALIAEPELVVLESDHDGCIFTAYDEILEAASKYEALEALVLLRDDTEILHPATLGVIRALLAVPAIVAVGAVGARNVTSLRWWEGDVVGGISSLGGVLGPGAPRPEEAHVLGPGLIALAPRAVRSLRFAGSGWHGSLGVEAELSYLLRIDGSRLAVIDLPLYRHGAPFPLEDHDLLVADAAWRWRWSNV